MGRGGDQTVQQHGRSSGSSDDEQLYTWDEVRRHVSRDDKWLVIDNEIYDITAWSRRHPGGSKVISHYAGQDASEAFTAFHNNMKFVRKYLNAIHIGSINTDKKDQFSEENTIKNDFYELRQNLTKMGLFKPSIFFYVTNIGHLLLLETFALAMLYFYGNTWTGWLLALFASVTMQAQAGWSQHDYGHQSVMGTTKLNNAVHYFVMCVLKGAGRDWWNHLHYQHHAKPNVLDKDPDVRLDALFVLGDSMSKRTAQKKEKNIPYNWQHRYFFIVGPPLLFPIYFQYMIFKHSFTRKKWLDIGFMSVFYLKSTLGYWYLLGNVSSVIIFYVLVRMLESHWFVWVSQSNHIPMEIDVDQEESWLKTQLRATCNIDRGLFNDWFTGHLNFQIEHHLFPTMPRHNLYKAKPFVQSICKKHNIEYKCKPLGKAFYDIFLELKRSGKVWEMYREQLFHPG